MVVAAGLEPAYAGVSDRCVNQLRHATMEIEVGIEPTFSVLQTVAYSSIGNST